MSEDRSTPAAAVHGAAAPSPGASGASGGSHTPSRGRGVGVTIGTVGVLGAALLLGVVPRGGGQRGVALQPQLARAAVEEKTAAPLVTVIQPTQAPRVARLELPGNIEGLEQTAVSARAAGYLRQWLADIGDHVKAGQPLAYISAPDADLQTTQAYAQVANSAAGVQQSRANVVMMQANVSQAQANVSKSIASEEQAKTQLLQARAALAQAEQQSAQQQANVAQAQASLDLAKLTAGRYDSLAAQGAVAQQAADQQDAAYKTSLATYHALQAALKASQASIAEAKENVRSAEANVAAYTDGVRASQGALAAAQANVTAAQANVNASSATLQANNANYKRNTVLQGYQTVVAPFDGIITARNVDVGSLVSASGNPAVADASGPGAGTISGAATNGGLFSMVRTDRVRTFISLPQQFVGGVQVGQTAQVSVTELGPKPFIGRIVRNTAVLDPVTRTLSTEIQLDNPGGRLRPGMFATVRLSLPQPTRAWRIPDSALITDANGTRVAVVTPAGTIHYQSVTVGTDYGKEMDITDGLNGGETLVSNPTPSLTEGEQVKTVAAPKLPAPGGQKGKRG